MHRIFVQSAGHLPKHRPAPPALPNHRPAYAERRSTRAIDKYAFQFSALLETEAAKSRKQQRTLKQIHEDLKELRFEESYDRIAAFVSTWREDQPERVNPASRRTIARLQGSRSDLKSIADAKKQ